MNTNTFEVTGANTFGDVRETAEQNAGSTFGQKLAFVMVWVAVSVPLMSVAPLLISTGESVEALSSKTIAPLASTGWLNVHVAWLGSLA